ARSRCGSKMKHQGLHRTGFNSRWSPIFANADPSMPLPSNAKLLRCTALRFRGHWGKETGPSAVEPDKNAARIQSQCGNVGAEFGPHAVALQIVLDVGNVKRGDRHSLVLEKRTYSSQCFRPCKITY